MIVYICVTETASTAIHVASFPLWQDDDITYVPGIVRSEDQR